MIRRIALAASVLALVCGSVHAQPGISMAFDPSVISAGMGGASAAVPWSAEPDEWANPALLGDHHGVRWLWSHTRIAPSLPGNISLGTNRFIIAAFGVGLETAGRPFSGLGGLKFDYGSSNATDPSGNVIGTFDTYDRTRIAGIGVSAQKLAAGLLAMRGSSVRAGLQHFDAGLGYTTKRNENQIAPIAIGRASAGAHDLGLVLRATYEARELGIPHAAGLAFDLAYAHAELSAGASQLAYPAGGGTFPLERATRDGGALRAAVDWHPDQHGSHGQQMGRLLRALTPLASLTLAYDNERVTSGGIGVGTSSHFGAELTALNVISVRAGRVSSAFNAMRGTSFGLGIALPVGEFGGARYDWANVPALAGSGVPDQSRHSFSIYVNPLTLWSAAR